MAATRYSRWHSIPVRVLAGFGAMLLLQLAVAGAAWWSDNQVATASRADAAAETRVGLVRAASRKLSDMQADLATYLRTGSAADYDALTATLDGYLIAVATVTREGAGDEALKLHSEKLRSDLTAVVAAATARRTAAGSLLDVSKQAQNALVALAGLAARLESAAETALLSNVAGTALRPIATIAIYVGNDSPQDRNVIQSGLSELTVALREVTASERPARLQRLAGAVSERLALLEPAMTALDTATVARNASLAAVKSGVAAVRTTMSAINARIVAERTARQQEVQHAREMGQTILLSAIAFGCVLGIACALLVGLSITRPIHRLAQAMRRLADGVLGTTVPDRERRDEIGGMAVAVQVFKDNMQRNVELAAAQERQKHETALERRQTLERVADAFELRIGEMVTSLANGSSDLENTAQAMTGAASDNERQAAVVEEAAGRASAGVQTSAAAAEQLTSSIAEISRQVTRSAEVNAEVVEQARRSGAVVKALADGASTIGQVIALISDIASRTNLLALNATIEAARAGEAGRGFAVVAAEVKNLAAQTAAATEQVTTHIATIQATTDEAVQAIGGIASAIDAAGEIASSVAASVQQQGAATAEISRNVQSTATATQGVATTIVGVRTVAHQTGAAARHVLSAAGDVSRQASQLSDQVRGFVSEVRAA